MTSSSTYNKVIDQLRAAYATSAAQRDQTPKKAWKIDERAQFLERLAVEGRKLLLEVGAGTGHDALFFKDNGIDVTVTDLSPEMVARCREKGLDAHVMDFLHLDFSDESFDAAYAMNCFLHVPNADLPTVLREISRLLVPDGLFYLGVYGGFSEEGLDENDWHDPPRFFSHRTDAEIQRFVAERFDIVDLHVVEPDALHFQSLTLRRR